MAQRTNPVTFVDFTERSLSFLVGKSFGFVP
jgi:hypothetical protein